jgi:selenoprotein W-related protein
MAIVADDALPADAARPRLSIEYCTQCGWTARAAWIAQELLGTFQHDVAEVALVPGTGGVLKVRVDGTVVWDRREDGFPLPTDLKQRVRDHIDPDRDLGHADRTERS